jgi:hypothetical protein
MNLREKVQGVLVDVASSLIALPPSPVKLEPLEKHPFAIEKKLIQHPYLGEMGLEVRGFLGPIEPWLRSGWIIPARRPALYPGTSAFSDPAYFERVNAIKAIYGLREMVGRLESIRQSEIDVTPELADDKFRLTVSSMVSTDLGLTLMARRDLRHAFYQRYGHDDLIPTRWHFALSSQSYSDDDFEETARSVIAPSYLPSAFENPSFEFPKHIGIQLRNVPYNPDRNSNPERMARLASQASAIMGLPVLVYGKGEDFALPGTPRTIDLIPAGMEQMHAELGLLKNCALMIAPDSGWADLMGWLRVPTILEQLFFPWGFEGLRPFSPRITLADENNLRASIEAVTAEGAECVLPGRNADGPQNDFLNPGGATCRAYWQIFMGQESQE